jgi:hypothetical protein
MRSMEIKATVQIPSTDDFAGRFPQYGPRARNEGTGLFDLVMRPEVFIAAAVLTEKLSLPGVTAVAAEACELVGAGFSGTDRQFLGALICSLMETNDYQKTGKKRAVPHHAWSRGEVYAAPSSGSPLSWRTTVSTAR